MNKAVFVDKDGTLIKDVPYNIKPELISFEDGVMDGLRVLKQYAFLLVIISNQSGIAHGYFTEDEFLNVKEAISEQLATNRISLDGFYYCPHHPDGLSAEYQSICSCRKPKPGMILQAARDLNIDLHSSWMIGDILDDVEAGNRAGCKTILINNGNETKWRLSTQRTPDHVAGNFFEAALFILNNPVKQFTTHEQKLG
ncbi:MAG TPA: HAD family hydrolase [Flavitalea sp.]|nr:HAD family hydrolase [Flavitalea sp.]